eukprot:1190382-Prorocentrum_minimum.AAC.1
MAAGFPRNPSCPSGRPDHPPVRAGDNSTATVWTPTLVCHPSGRERMKSRICAFSQHRSISAKGAPIRP